MKSRVPFLALVLAACGVSAAERPDSAAARPTDSTAAVGDTGAGVALATVAPAASDAPRSPAPAAPARAATRRSGHDLMSDTTTVRALYVNRWATHSARKMAKLIGFADSTEINALVLEINHA